MATIEGCVYAALFVALCGGRILPAQVPITVIVDRTQACERCSITLTHVATLLSPDTSPDLGAIEVHSVKFVGSPE